MKGLRNKGGRDKIAERKREKKKKGRKNRKRKRERKGVSEVESS